MRNEKKGSLSLSINAIVVLILAITMLGLALSFIRTMFGKVSGQVEAVAANEPDPIPAGPSKMLTLSRETIVLSPSESSGIKFSTYNGGGFPWDSDNSGAQAATTENPANILNTATGCFTTVFTVSPTQPQIQKVIGVGNTVQSQVVFKAANVGGQDVVCQICTYEIGCKGHTDDADNVCDIGVNYVAGKVGCADVRVVIK